jgi:hypothetical protein
LTSGQWAIWGFFAKQLGGRPGASINESIDSSHAYTYEAESFPNRLASYFPHDSTKETENSGKPEKECFREGTIIPNDRNGNQQNDSFCKIWCVSVERIKEGCGNRRTK